MLPIIGGALLTALIALIVGRSNGEEMTQILSQQAERAIASVGGAGVTANFQTASGWPTRHPVLDGAQDHDEATRLAIARAVAAVPGVGGVRWADGTIAAESDAQPLTPLHCQEDVEALLSARTIRFEESKSSIDRPSLVLLDEVAAALRPCLGSIIAITGHTDSSGSAAANLELSQDRAEAVERALIARGIPADGLRSRGVGSSDPVEGLAPADPANRRIEFSVIATKPLRPSPVDTPSAR